MRNLFIAIGIATSIGFSQSAPSVNWHAPVKVKMVMGQIRQNSLNQSIVGFYHYGSTGFCGEGQTYPLTWLVEYHKPGTDVNLGNAKSNQAILLTAMSTGQYIRIHYQADYCYADGIILCADENNCNPTEAPIH